MRSFPRIRIANANVLRTMMVAGVLAGWALFHGALALSSLRRNSPTIDEVAHLPAGVSYLQQRTFALYHQNPPLVKMLAALPVVASKPQVNYSGSWAHAFSRGYSPSHTSFGGEFVRSNPSRYFTFFARGRAVVVALSLFGLFFTYLWASELWGRVGGLVSVALWAVSPNLLAHAGLVTTDLGATASGFASTYFFWRWLKGRTWKRASVCGLMLGLAQLAKFSNLILFAVWPCLLAFWRLAQRVASERDLPEEPLPGRSTLVTLTQTGLMLVLSVLVINLGYGFEGTGQPLGEFGFLHPALTTWNPSEVATDDRSPPKREIDRRRWNRFRETVFERLPVPLPVHYVLGFDDQWFETSSTTGGGYFVYLRGEIRQSGWWYYYFYALAVKVPLGTWLLLATAVVLAIRRTEFRGNLRDEFVLAFPPVLILVATALLTDINLGLRYVLPIFPYVFVFIGRLGRTFLASPAPSKLLRSLIAAGLLWNAVSAVVIWPHYLSYFNLLAGGPSNGHRHLIDSNLDWGQDLFEIERWLEKNPQTEPIGLAYFGTVEPRLAGIDNYFIPPRDPRTLPAAEDLLPHEKRGIQPGLYAISVNLLQGLPFPGFISEGRLARVPPYTFSYFRQLEPVARAGYSIWIFRVGPEEAKRLNEVLLQESPGQGR